MAASGGARVVARARGDRGGKAGEHGTAGAVRALATLLDDEGGQTDQPLLGTLLDRRANAVDGEIRRAADHLLRRAAPWAVEPGPALAKLLEAVEGERGRQVFLGWSLSRSRSTLTELAPRLGVSAARVGQIRDRAEAQVRAASARAPAPVPWLTASLRRRLGTVVLDCDAEEALDDHGLAGAGPLIRQLALWLSGPFQPVAKSSAWLAVVPKEMLAGTRAAMALDGGVRPLAEVVAELTEMGVAPGRVMPWLSACGGAIVQDLVVSTAGRLSQVAERVLEAQGHGMTAEEVATCLAHDGLQVALRTLARAMAGPCFRWVAGERAELADWPRAEASTAGRPALQSTTPAGPALQSTTPAGRKGAGSAGAARKASGPTPTASPDVQRAWLWVRVDPDVLRGVAATVPAAIAELVGLAPRRRRTFSSRYGPVTLAYENDQPTRGSVRAVALAAGAAQGDTLRLGFSPAGDITVEVHRASGGPQPATPQPATPQPAGSRPVRPTGTGPRQAAGQSDRPTRSRGVS